MKYKFSKFRNSGRSSLWLLGLGTFFLIGCSTPQTKALRHVEVGMTKSEVLEMVGDPARTGREHGQDRWAYVNHNGTGEAVTYVFFSEGHVTYVGPSEELIDPKLRAHEDAGGAVTAEPTASSPKKTEDFKPVGE